MSIPVFHYRRGERYYSIEMTFFLPSQATFSVSLAPSLPSKQRD